MFRFAEGSNYAQVKDTGVQLQWRPVSQNEANDVGCPNATHALIGRNGAIYGSLIPVTGRAVKVKGWPTRKGILTDWVRADGESSFRLYIGE